ncbi:hypothetical protein H6P81_007099 [Aristolochia fimbriata]|uniref:Terpene synthase metal-binding domain-containing protein n=1 Tax=Aristolochia fimbriata TaxID=158543 RepID=A0AAV7F1D6_ARIFI|nr:hypothetical protein H6P81_007099 [Aristolochia fimbriata]
MEGLPEYMKPLYNEIVTLFKETEEKLDEEGYPNQIGYVGLGIESVQLTIYFFLVSLQLQELFWAYFKEAEWHHKGYTPGTEEYLHVATKSAGYHALCTLTMVFMKEASIEAFEWSKSYPKIIQSVAEMSRLMDDFASHEFEQERSHIPSSVECFMEEKGKTKEEVHGMFKSFYHQTWKDVNEACLRPTPFPMCIIGKPVNLARVIEALYYGNGKDEYTFSAGRIKEMIT